MKKKKSEQIGAWLVGIFMRVIQRNKTIPATTSQQQQWEPKHVVYVNAFMESGFFSFEVTIAFFTLDPAKIGGSGFGTKKGGIFYYLWKAKLKNFNA